MNYTLTAYSPSANSETNCGQYTTNMLSSYAWKNLKISGDNLFIAG